MKIFSKFKFIAAVHLGVLLIGSSANALAAEKLDIGKDEYDSACAVCHGRTGKGDGPLKLQLVNRMPDLTVLAKNNNGIFPFDRVYQIIDGRQEVKSHGPREMPVWGRAFNNQTSIYFENYPPQDTESAARSRILALVEYLYRLQAK
jgi:mono/diheme cytochrome c family protein